MFSGRSFGAPPCQVRGRCTVSRLCRDMKDCWIIRWYEKPDKDLGFIRFSCTSMSQRLIARSVDILPAFSIAHFCRTPNSDTPGAYAPPYECAPEMRQGPCYKCEYNVPENPGPPDIFSGVGEGGVRTPPVRIMNPISLMDMRMSAKRDNC